MSSLGSVPKYLLAQPPSPAVVDHSPPAMAKVGTVVGLDLFPLYSDVLQVVLRHLDLLEFRTAVQLSKQWYSVIKIMKSCGLTSYCSRVDLIPPTSILAHHIGHANFFEAAVRQSPNFLYKAAEILPNLTSMALRLSNFGAGSYNPGLTLNLPKRLQHLNCQVDSGCLSALLTAINQLPHLQSLKLTIKRGVGGDSFHTVDFSPLLPHKLPLLQAFRMNIRSDIPGYFEPFTTNPLSRTLVAFLRESNLTELDIHNPQFFELHAALQQLAPDQKPWPLIQSLSYVVMDSVTLDRTLLDQLVKFPAMTQLTPQYVALQPSDIQLLSRFPNLRHLQLHRCGHHEVQLSSEAVLAACKLHPRLSKLRLCHSKLTSEELNECLARLPQLTALELDSCKGLATLAPLMNHEVPQRLAHLKILSCQFPRTEATEIILKLQQLRILKLRDAFASDEPAIDWNLFRDTSRTCALPKLIGSDVTGYYR